MTDTRLENEEHCRFKAEQLNDRLSLHLVPSDVEKYPEFIKLLTSLTKHISPECVSVASEKDLKQAKDVLQLEKHRWLLNHILYTEVQDLILDYRIKSQDISLSSNNKKFLEVLENNLKCNEICDYLDFSPDPSVKAKLLGLTEDDVHRNNPYKQHVSSCSARLIPEIEERLKIKCEEIYQFEDPSTSTSDKSKLTIAKANQLPAKVEILKKKIENEERLLKQDQVKREKQFWIYYQTLVDCLSILQKLILDFRLRDQAESDTINVKYLKSRCDAMTLKVRLCQLQVLCDTYTAETVKVLRTIRNHLDEATEEGNKDLGRINRALTAYDSVGMGFDGLVEEYTKLRSDLENKRWVMTELQQNS